MSYVALFVSDEMSVATSRRVFAPSELESLADARALVGAIEAWRAGAAARQEAAAELAREDGWRAGFEAGEREARARLARREIELAAQSQRERAALRTQTEACVAMLAMEVVRKLAGELDAAELVCGLARQAVRQLLDDEPVTLVVHPAAHARVRERCGPREAGRDRWPVVAVEEDATLAPFDCRLVTRAGTTIAGLDTQLRRIEAAWNEVGEAT